MLRITPIKEKAEQARLCALCETEFRPEALCYQAYDEDVFLGICQFDLGERGVIYDLLTPPGVDDREALFIMGRQTLNFMDLCGTHEAYLESGHPMDAGFVKWLGFRTREDGTLYMNLTGFFEEPCKHHGD